MSGFHVSFPATSTNYSCASFFTRNYLLALQEHSEAKLIEPGYSCTSIPDFLEWRGAPLPLALSTRQSLRNLTEGSRQLDCSKSKSVQEYLIEVIKSLGPLTVKSTSRPTRKLIGIVFQVQDHKPYDLTEVCDLPLLLEPLILKKDPLKFFSPDNCTAKALPFVTIEDPFDATDSIQDLKPCFPVIDPHFDQFKIHLDTKKALFVPIPDMEMTPLLFFESKIAQIPSKEPQTLKSPPISIVKPTVVTGNAPESSKQSEITSNCSPETTDWPDLQDPGAILPFSNENLQFSFPDWDDVALKDLLRIEHTPVVSSIPELNQTSLTKPLVQVLNLPPTPKPPGIPQEFLLASKESASCTEMKSVAENREETIPKTVVEDKTAIPSKLKSFISRVKSRKRNHMQNTAPPVRLKHKNTPIPSKEDLIIIEIPAASQLLHCLNVLQMAGVPLLHELLKTNLRLPSTFSLVKPEHTRTLVRQIYEQRKCKATSGTLSKGDRVYGVVVALHGLVKTADVMVNCDIDLGLTVFETFKASYAENFGFSDWIQVVTQVLAKNKRIEAPLHPKMVQLCQIVEQYEAYRGRILVSFNRYATELQDILTRTLVSTKITCLPWGDNKTADVYWTSTQNALTAILASEIALMIYYEDPVGRPGIKQLLLRTIWGEKLLPEPSQPVNRDEEQEKEGCEEPHLEPKRKKKKPNTIRNALLEEQEVLKAALAKIKPNSEVKECQNVPSESKRTKLDCESIQTVHAAFLKPGKPNEGDLNTVLESIEPKKSHPRPNLPLIFHKRLLDLFERTVVDLELKWNSTVHECDYSFMLNDPVAHLRQADVICDGFTSMLITTLEEEAVFERILQLRASTCTLWVLLWGPGLQPNKLTIFMSFAHFLKKQTSEFRLRWQLISSQANLAITVEKAARKAAEEAEKRSINAWHEFKCPWNASEHWRVLVKVPCLNAFSAWLLLQRADLRTLVGSSLEFLTSRYPELPSKVLQAMEFSNILQGTRQFFQAPPLLPHHENPSQEINPQMTPIRSGPGPGEVHYPRMEPIPPSFNHPYPHMDPNLHYHHHQQQQQQQWVSKPVQNPPAAYYAPPLPPAQPQFRDQQFRERYNHAYNPPPPDPYNYYNPPPEPQRLPYAPHPLPAQIPPPAPPQPVEVRETPPRPLPPAPRLPEKREMTRTEFYRQYKQQESLKLQQRLNGIPPRTAPHLLPPVPPPQLPESPQERPIYREENAYWQPQAPPQAPLLRPAPVPAQPAQPSHPWAAAEPVLSGPRYYQEPPTVAKAEAPLDLSVRSTQADPMRGPWPLNGENNHSNTPRFHYQAQETFREPPKLEPYHRTPPWPHNQPYRPPPLPNNTLRMPTMDLSPSFGQQAPRYPAQNSQLPVRIPPVATVSATVRDFPAAPRVSAAQAQQQRYREFSVKSNSLNHFPTQFPPTKQQQRPVGVALVSVKLPHAIPTPLNELSEKNWPKTAVSPILTPKFRTKAELKQMTPPYNSNKSYVPTTPRLLTADDPLSAWRNACMNRSHDKSESPILVKIIEEKSLIESPPILSDEAEQAEKVPKVEKVLEAKKVKEEVKEESNKKISEESVKIESEEEDAFDRLFSNQCKELESDLAQQSSQLRRVKRLSADLNDSIQGDLGEPSTSKEGLQDLDVPAEDEKEEVEDKKQYSSEEDVPLSLRAKNHQKGSSSNAKKVKFEKKLSRKGKSLQVACLRGPHTRSGKRRRLSSSEESAESSPSKSSDSSSEAEEEELEPRMTRTRTRLRTRRRRGTLNVIKSDEEVEESLKNRLRSKRSTPVKRKRPVLAEEDEGEEIENESGLQPILVKENQDRDQEDQANQSKYYPGWEGELLQYKKKCRMPLQLIRVHKVSAKVESAEEKGSDVVTIEESSAEKLHWSSKVKQLSIEKKVTVNSPIPSEEVKVGEENQGKKTEENAPETQEIAIKLSDATPRARFRIFRRRFRSGLDFIRKKKKPTVKKGNEEEAKSNKIVKSNKSYALLGPSLDPATEIRSWVVNKSAGETILHRAARLGYLEGICYLLGRPETVVSVRDNAMYTPLHEAAAKGHMHVAKVLLLHGADESAAARGGIRPLHEAVDNNHLEVTRLLLSYGADPRLATYAGLTPLALAKTNLEDDEEDAEDEEEDSNALLENDSKRMVDFLESHLKDVEGQSKMPFTFFGSAALMDGLESGFNVLEANSIPQAAGTDLVFECTAYPLPQCYQLPSRPGKFVLLEDLLQIGAVIDPRQCQRLRKKAFSLTREEWNQVKEVAKPRPVSPVRDPVLMVPYDEEVKEVLEVEEVVISSRS